MWRGGNDESDGPSQLIDLESRSDNSEALGLYCWQDSSGFNRAARKMGRFGEKIIVNSAINKIMRGYSSGGSVFFVLLRYN